MIRSGIHMAQTEEEKLAVYRFRYHIYVEEMGRYTTTADHSARRLADPEDDRSCVVYATDGADVIGSLRITWGGEGLSERRAECWASSFAAPASLGRSRSRSSGSVTRSRGSNSTCLATVSTIRATMSAG